MGKFRSRVPGMVYGCRIETVENGTSISCFVLLNFRENASYVRKSLRKTKIVGTIGPASENKLEEKLFYKEELNKGTWYIITTAFTFIDDKLIKQEVVKEERTFQKCDCNK